MADEKRTCPVCGGSLAPQGKDWLCTVRLKYVHDPRARIQYFKCERCGREVEVLDPTMDEREGEYREYWYNNR